MWLETSAPLLSAGEQYELIQLLEQETEAMNDFGQQLADSYLQWSHTLGNALDMGQVA